MLYATVLFFQPPISATHSSIRPQKREFPANRAINFRMEKSERWMLFEYNGLELVILSKPFKTKKLAEKERGKYPERERRKIGVGLVRVKV